MRKQQQLKIRRASNADKGAVLAFCAQTWETGDYIDAVWDEWLHEPCSTLLVGIINDRPVALAHVSVIEGEGWFEGLRVAPEQRGQGFGRTILEASIDEARRLGASVLRLITRDTNMVMTGLLAQLGFERCFDAVWCNAPFQAGPAPRLVQRPAEILERDLAEAPLLRDTGGLYADGWSFRSLTRNALERHLDAQQVVQMPDVEGWAIVMLDGESDRPAVAISTGDVSALYRALRAHPLAEKHGAIHAFVPVGSESERMVLAAGYQPRPNRFGVFAHPL